MFELLHQYDDLLTDGKMLVMPGLQRAGYFCEGVVQSAEFVSLSELGLKKHAHDMLPHQVPLL